MKKHELKEKQKKVDNARAGELLHKLKNTHKLDDIEKIELRNILENNKSTKVDEASAEYIGLSNSKNKGAKLAFYIATILFVGLAIYSSFYIVNSKKYQNSLVKELSAQQKAYEELKENNQELKNTISNLNGDINSLQIQLNQKPTTVYVPQAPTYTPSSYTSCNDNFFGGFNCTTY